MIAILSSWWVLFAGVALASQAPQESTASVPLPSKPPTARLIVGDKPGENNPLYDFGSAMVGQLVSHTFTLRNETAQPLTIARLQSSCGCLSLVLPDQNQAD